jgi:predicted metal-dependent phosphotriesterase family hydrolase
MVEMIRTIGHERCTLSTDYGWTTELPHPAAGMRDFLEKLWNHGMTEEELTTMVAVNPARLLGL